MTNNSSKTPKAEIQRSVQSFAQRTLREKGDPAVLSYAMAAAEAL
jgi:hypothetical protein